MDFGSKGSFEHAQRVEKYVKGHNRGERSRQIRSANKKMRRNLKPKGPRKRDWEAEDNENWEALDYEQQERIMPRDERDRRRAVEQAAFSQADTPNDSPDEYAPAATGNRGVVVSIASGLCYAAVDGVTLQCRLRGRLSAQQTGFTNAVAVGDEVIVTEDGAGGGIIEEVLPRRTVLARPDVFHSHLRQVIVANAHQLLIVSAWRDPVIWLELIDRYLIAAQRSGLEAVICVNKADLIEDDAEYQETLKPYFDLGHRVIRTSALTGEGVEKLRAILHSRITVLAGLSGTGKSSLISAVQPGLELRTGAVSDYSGEGRHTTTQATLHPLGTGGAVVDTPGIREFGLAGLRQRELGDFFPEIAALASGCRFADCTHIKEPGCAVQAAGASGTIPSSRLHSYRMIFETLPA